MAAVEAADVVVIGTGFGGAIPAYYLSAGGARVVMLERGPRFASEDFTQDLRLSRTFVIRQGWRLTLVGEVFNLLNTPNLQGYTGDLTNPGFGQPISRVDQAFGSGGPRAVQLGLKMSF